MATITGYAGPTAPGIYYDRIPIRAYAATHARAQRDGRRVVIRDVVWADVVDFRPVRVG